MEKPIFVQQDSSRNVVGKHSANLSRVSDKSNSIKESINMRGDEDDIEDEVG